MSESTNVDNRENFDKPAMVVGVGFINGKEFEKSVEMHQGKDIEKDLKSYEEDMTIPKEGLEYYIETWKESIRYWEKRLETATGKDKAELEEKIEKYQSHISIAQSKLDKLLDRGNER